MSTRAYLPRHRRRGRHAARTRRPRLVVALIGLTGLALASCGSNLPASPPQSETADDPAPHDFYGVTPLPVPMAKDPAKRAGGPVDKEPVPNTGATSGALCLEDWTDGFPVAEAAAEYEGIVEVVVADDCSEYASRVWVQTVIRDEDWSGWYNAPINDPRDGAALISLNLGQAFRHDPHSWRMVLVHEIGHALGLSHTHEVQSVMDPLEYAEVDGLTDVDLANLAELYP